MIQSQLNKIINSIKYKYMIPMNLMINFIILNKYKIKKN